MSTDEPSSSFDKTITPPSYKRVLYVPNKYTWTSSREIVIEPYHNSFQIFNYDKPAELWHGMLVTGLSYVYKDVQTKLDVSKVLIDKDYDRARMYYWILNMKPTTMVIPAQAEFTIHFKEIVVEDTTRWIYGPILFDYPAGSDYQDQIVSLRRATTEACAFDIIFDKTYKIEAKGLLNLEIPLAYAYHSRPYTFILRSKYTRLGLKIDLVNSKDENVVVITLVNDNNVMLYLGSRFLCVIPELQHFYFEKDKHVIGYIYNEENGSKEIIIERLKRQRKLKQDDNDDE